MPADPAAAGAIAAQAAPSARARVFFALWPPNDLAGELDGIAQQFAEQSGGRPSRQETLHLTLAFLGDIAETRLPELCQAARAIEAPAFGLQLDKLDFWSHKHLLWGGFSAPPPALAKLALELRADVQAAGFDLPNPAQGFLPHVSLVRRVPAGLPPAAFRLDRALSLPAWRCDRFVLVRSCPAAAGADYRTLAEFPLMASDPRPDKSLR